MSLLDTTRAAHEMSVYYRARVLCAQAEPHRGGSPCAAHRQEARRQLSTVASLASTGVHPHPGAEGARNGTVGCVSGPPLGRPDSSNLTDNRARDTTPDPAERASDLARIEGYQR